MPCPQCEALKLNATAIATGQLTRKRSGYWILKSKTCTCNDLTADKGNSSVGDNKTAVQQTNEIVQGIKLTLNDDTANLLESEIDKMSANGTVNGDGAATGSEAATGDTRRLSVPPSMQTNQDAVELVQMVDDLLNELTVNFSNACKDVFEKLDDMSNRIDAMEARALAAQAAEEAEEAAAKADSK